MWYLENIRCTTQDQVSFPFVAQMLHLIPHTLPDSEVAIWNDGNDSYFHHKCDHGTRHSRDRT